MTYTNTQWKVIINNKQVFSHENIVFQERRLIKAPCFLPGQKAVSNFEELKSSSIFLMSGEGYEWDDEAWRSPSLICVAMSRTAPGPCGINTVDVLEAAPISFMVSKYCVTRIMSITSLVLVPGTLSEKPSTLSLRPSTIACRCLAIPIPERYLDSASPSALLICRIFSASALSFAATLNLEADKVYTLN